MSPLRLLTVVGFIVVLAVPYLLRPAEDGPDPDALPLVVLTPHTQAIWYEFERAFSAWHQEKYGQPVDIDWRNPGGTSAIARFLDARYDAVTAVEGLPLEFVMH